MCHLLIPVPSVQGQKWRNQYTDGRKLIKEEGLALSFGANLLSCHKPAPLMYKPIHYSFYDVRVFHKVYGEMKSKEIYFGVCIPKSTPSFSICHELFEDSLTFKIFLSK